MNILKLFFPRQTIISSIVIRISIVGISFFNLGEILYANENLGIDSKLLANRTKNICTYQYIEDISNRELDPASNARLKSLSFLKFLLETNGKSCNKIESIDVGHIYKKLNYQGASKEKIKQSIKNHTAKKENTELANFFAQIFNEIPKHFSDISLSDTDLFHGHLVDTEDDILLVFHSAECPRTLDALASGGCNGKIGSFASHLGNDLTRPTLKTLKRNLIWSFNNEKIWRINTSGDLKFLVYNQEQINNIGILEKLETKERKAASGFYLIPNKILNSWKSITDNVTKNALVFNTMNETFLGKVKYVVNYKTTNGQLPSSTSSTVISSSSISTSSSTTTNSNRHSDVQAERVSTNAQTLKIFFSN